jgi:hypothetical protein
MQLAGRIAGIKSFFWKRQLFLPGNGKSMTMAARRGLFRAAATDATELDISRLHRYIQEIHSLARHLCAGSIPARGCVPHVSCRAWLMEYCCAMLPH